MARVTCFWLFLVHLYPTQVQSSDAPVYVQRGKDVLLDVDNVTETFRLFVWKFEKNDLVLVTFSPGTNAEISEDYTGRIGFSEKNKYSVILKNIQETDSGVYIGREIGKKDLTLVQLNIIVQDVVSPVVLKVNSVSNSSDSCNVTLTCSAADSHINSTFRCDNQKCDQDGGNQSKITDSSATLEVYLMNAGVICKHSNRVSSTEDTTDINDVCPQNTGTEKDNVSETGVVVPVVVVVVVVLVIIGGGLAFYRHRKKKQGVPIDSTIYAVPMVETPIVPDDAPDGNEALDSSPLSVYSLAGPQGGSSGAADKVDKPLPESLYAQIEKHPRA